MTFLLSASGMSLSNELSSVLLKVSQVAFADDMTLLSLFPSFLGHLMHEETQYSKIWRYDYNQSKSGVVVLGESWVQHNCEKTSQTLGIRWQCCY